MTTYKKTVAELSIVSVDDGVAVMLDKLSGETFHLTVGCTAEIQHRINVDGPEVLIAPLKSGLEWAGFREDRSLQ